MIVSTELDRVNNSNMEAPSFSVVIPTYNRADDVGRAIRSVINQEYSNIEILVIDDGSTDHTEQVVRDFRDNRIVYEWMPNSGGPAAPRNRGISLSKAPWICFLDADDWWTPNKLTVCEKYLNYEVDIVYHNLIINDESQKKLWRRTVEGRRLKKPVLIDLLINGNALPNSSVIVRKDILVEAGGFDEDESMVASEDYNAWLKISKLTDNFLFINQNLGYYSVHSGNLSRKDMSINWENSCKEFLPHLSEGHQAKVMANISHIRGLYEYRVGSLYNAEQNLLRSLKYSSFESRFRSIRFLIAIKFRKLLY
jgi:glycosyltransferase involved in cell wall biosynthesis